MAKKDSQDTMVLPEIENEVIYVGLDDGHADCKLVTSTGETFVMPSRIVEGVHSMTFFGEGDSYSVIETVDEFGDVEAFTINANLLKSIDTRVPSFPYSSVNLALVHSILGKAGLGGKNVQICTGLPISSAYIPSTGKPNNEIIDKKKANLYRKVQSPGLEVATIEKNSICSEGVAAFFDLVLDMNGNKTKFYDEVQNSMNMVIDIGGKTTDFAVLGKGGAVFDTQHSGSLDFGILDIADTLADAVNKFLNRTVHTGNDAVIQSMIKETPILPHNGKRIDFSETLENIKRIAAKKIYTKISDKVETGVFHSIIFVGGGSEFLFDVMKNYYPNQAVLAENPQFANARGMLKVAMFLN